MNITDPVVIFHVDPKAGHDVYGHTGRNLTMTAEEVAARTVPPGTEYVVITEPRPTGEHLWRDGAWTLPPFDVVKARTLAHADLIGHMNDFTHPFTDGRSADEVGSWPSKAAGATVVLAGGNSTVISAESTALSEPVRVVAVKINTKSELYLRAIGTLSAIRQIADTAFTLADTQVEIDMALNRAIESLNQVDIT